VRNGTAALLKAYAKHGLVPTREVPKWFTEALAPTLGKRQNGQAPAVPNGVEYLVSTTIGGQTLSLDFDSGSSDL
jgi:aspergillopepsin I